MPAQAKPSLARARAKVLVWLAVWLIFTQTQLARASIKRCRGCLRMASSYSLTQSLIRRGVLSKAIYYLLMKLK